MMARCYDPESHKYKSYGARGIRVCDRWICFKLFAADVGSRPDGMTLNRIDNNGNYSPENCEWASDRTQAQNRRNNVLITHGGVTRCISEWARIIGVTREALRNRLNKGWSVCDAIETPFKSQK